MTNEYARTCKEVFEVLKLTPKEQLELIPIEVLNKLKMDSMDYTEKYELKFDKIGEPKISHEAQIMILAIYRKYFLEEKEKNILNKKLQKNDDKIEIKKVENYNNTNDIFYKQKPVESQRLRSESDFEDKVYENTSKTDSEKNALIINENKIMKLIKNIINKIKNIFC